MYSPSQRHSCRLKKEGLLTFRTRGNQLYVNISVRGCCRCATDFGKSTFSMGLLRKKLILLVIFLKSCNFSEFFVKSCKLWDFVGQSVKSSDDRLFYRFRMNVEAFKSQSVDKSVVNKGNILTNFSEKLLN